MKVYLHIKSTLQKVSILLEIFTHGSSEFPWYLHIKPSAKGSKKMEIKLELIQRIFKINKGNFFLMHILTGVIAYGSLDTKIGLIDLCHILLS